MIELKHDWVCFSTVYTRMLFEVIEQEPAHLVIAILLLGVVAEVLCLCPSFIDLSVYDFAAWLAVIL